MNLFDNYNLLLKSCIDSNYDFVDFCRINQTSNKSIIIRHDIDCSPNLALKMAKIEHKMGVKATYFFMLRSPFYNLFTRANNEAVKEIINLGHNIGLHYDEGYAARDERLQELIDEEIKMLENNFDIKITVVSFHQPSEKIVNNDIFITQINTYDKKYFKDIKYLSDSNMKFKEDPISIIKSNTFKKIQMLIHPMWWTIKGDTTEEKFKNTIELNFEAEQKQILSTERAYGKGKTIKFYKYQ
jgi:hypothetical protein